jgi:hypothetical protein
MNAIHHSVLVVEVGIDGIMGGLEFGAKAVVLLGQFVGPERRIDPDKGGHYKPNDT